MPTWIRGISIPAAMLGILVFRLPLSGQGQQENQCRADVRHLKVPEHGSIDEVVGLSQPPLMSLFSQDGVDVFSATDFKAMQVFHKSGMSLASALTIIVVYQDERVRQEKIEYVRKFFPYANLQNANDLKFATFRFEFLPVWVDDVLTRKWVISGMAYFRPMSCVTPGIPSSDYLEATMLYGHNSIAGYTPLMPLPEGWPRNPPIPVLPNSVLSKALDAMKDLGKSYGLLN